MEKKGEDTKRLRELTEKILRLEKERDEYLNGWKRAKADLANFKKDTAESLSRFNDLIKVGFVREVLPVLDALGEAEKNNIEGLVPIQKLFESILKGEQVEEIVPQAGEEFDPALHEAVEGVGTTIKECRQKGYRYNLHVVRPAKVVVSESDDRLTN